MERKETTSSGNAAGQRKMKWGRFLTDFFGSKQTAVCVLENIETLWYELWTIEKSFYVFSYLCGSL